MLFSRSTLESGIRVVTERMPEVRAAALGFWVGVGSRDEPAEIQGASHFLEHVLFKGTERRSALDIAEAFDAVGGEANAFSAKEYTCVHARVLDEDLPMALEIVADMVLDPAFRPEELESERNVILEEIAMHEDTPDDLVHDLFAETVFGAHPLGRSVLGTAETVGAVTPGRLADFHGASYRTRNIVVSAAGNVPHEQMLDLVRDVFPADGSEPVRRPPTVPTPAASLRVVTRKTEQVHLVLGGIGYSRQHPDRFAWGVLDTLLGGGMSSRLFQEIREKRGLAYSVYSYRSTFGETGLWAVYAGTTPAHAPEVMKLVADELDRLAGDGITEEELLRAKGHMKGSLVLSLEDSYSRMSRLGKSELVHGEILSVDELLARVEAVTLEDVCRVARDLLRAESRVLTLIGPLAEEDVAGWAGAA